MSPHGCTELISVYRSAPSRLLRFLAPCAVDRPIQLLGCAWSLPIQRGTAVPCCPAPALKADRAEKPACLPAAAQHVLPVRLGNPTVAQCSSLIASCAEFRLFRRSFNVRRLHAPNGNVLFDTPRSILATAKPPIVARQRIPCHVCRLDLTV